MSLSANDVLSKLYSAGASSGDSAKKSTDTKSSTGSTSSLGKDDFLKLLVAQMKNQDPLNPTNNTEFVAQLAQFSSLEQMTQVNDNLEKLVESNTATTGSINKAMTVNYMGKTITAETPDFVFDGESPVTLNFNTDTAFKSGKLEISNSSGEVVQTIKLGYVPTGYKSYTWDGLKKNGSAADAGDYSFKVSGTDESGTSVEAKPVFSGTVQGVSYIDGEYYLFTDGVMVPYDSIINVYSAD